MRRLIKANCKFLFGISLKDYFKYVILWAVTFYLSQWFSGEFTINFYVMALSVFLTTFISVMVLINSKDFIDDVRAKILLPEKTYILYIALIISITIYIFITKIGILLLVYDGIMCLEIYNLILLLSIFLVTVVVTFLVFLKTEKNDTVLILRRKRGKSNFMKYILRYYLSDKYYIINSTMIWIAGGIFGYLIMKRGNPIIYPMGIAIMCINTPLSIVISSDKSLIKKIQLLPNSFKIIEKSYFVFVFISNCIGVLIYILIGYFVNSIIYYNLIINGLVLAIISAIITVAMEKYYPIPRWKVITDLYRHPRKYIQIMIILILSVLLSFIFR